MYAFCWRGRTFLMDKVSMFEENVKDTSTWHLNHFIISFICSRTHPVNINTGKCFSLEVQKPTK